MRKTLILLAAMGLPLAGCATYDTAYGYGYDRYSSRYNYYNPYSYNPVISTVGVLGSAYGSSFSQAAANACASYASRYGAVHVTSVRQTDYDRMRVYGHVSRGYGTDDWGCTFRSDGRVTDFDI